MNWRQSVEVWRRLAALGVVVGLAMLALYITLTVVVPPEPKPLARVSAWVAVMALPNALALIALAGRPGRRSRVRLAWAAALFVALGVLTAPSVGIGWLVAGFLTFGAMRRAPREPATNGPLGRKCPLGARHS